MSDLLNIGVSGLLAAQHALAVTSNNVSNSNTEGYSRQRAGITNRALVYSAWEYLGTVANVADISQAYDAFLNGQVVKNTRISNQLKISYSYASQLDNLLADPQAGLTPALQDFFSAALGIANNLLDKRDRLQLYLLVGVQLMGQSNFAINIHIGNGKSLVTDTDSQRLGVMLNPHDYS